MIASPPILCIDDFNLLFEPLRLSVSGADILLKIKQTRAFPAHGLRTMQPFAVSFIGPLDHPLTQGTYSLLHPRQGVIELFLVPVARDANGFEYEAVFN